MPVSMSMEVAGWSMAAAWAGVRFRLRPMPVMMPRCWVAGSSICSERIPQIFLPLTSRSLGHLGWAEMRWVRRRSWTARAVAMVREGMAVRGAWVARYREQQRLVCGGAIQGRLKRPVPAVWS